MLFWSLRNQAIRRRVASLEAGCSSLAFSAKNPHLLAVGLMDGAVYIWTCAKKRCSRRRCLIRILEECARRAGLERGLGRQGRGQGRSAGHGLDGW